MSNPAITLEQPATTAFTDGQFTGTNGASGGNTPPGSFTGYARNSQHFWRVPPITPAIAERQPTSLSPNKLIVYINGINTSRTVHAYTVKLASVVSGANAIGIYNQSGDGVDTNMFFDLVQCLGDKTGLSNNAATNTAAKCVDDACVNRVFLNVVAHSQGALIMSRALRQGIGMLLDRYGRQNSTVRPLIDQVERRRNFFERVGRNLIGADDVDRIRLEAALRRYILPRVERQLGSYVTVQTYGGAGSFFPNGPRYRHVNNGWDPVSNAVGQGAWVSGGGRGATQVQIERNSGMRIRDVADHSIEGLYLQPSEHYVDRNGNKVDNDYVPIDMTIVR